MMGRTMMIMIKEEPMIMIVKTVLHTDNDGAHKLRKLRITVMIIVTYC